MPAVRLRPELPTVYVDWSTLVDAFKGLQLHAPATDKALAAAIDRASRAANLCMSFVHLYELLRWSDERARDECAIWLDHLDVVWLRVPEEVHDAELENLLRGAAAGRQRPPRVPALPSMLSLLPYEKEPEALAYALRKNSIKDFVREVSTSRLTPRIEQFATMSTAASRRFWQDRKEGLANHTEEEMRAVLDRRWDAKLVTQALEINRRLVLTHDSSYLVQRGALFVPPDEAFVRAAVRPLEEIKQVLPYAYLHHKVMQNRSFQLARRPTDGSRNFAAATRGDLFDQWHLVGAAYCDVFTCDAGTAAALDDGRSELGRARELVRAGSADVLAAQIAAALPA